MSQMNSNTQNKAFTALAQTLPMDVSTLGICSIDVRGTFTATLVVEGTVNGTDWFTLNVTPINGGTAVSSITAAGQWAATTAALSKIRVRCSAYTSGTATVVLFATDLTNPVELSGITLEVNLDNANDDVLVYGWDGTANQKIKTDSGGELQVDVLSSALPTGAATAANQTTIIGHVDGIEGLLTTIDADTGNIDTSLNNIETFTTDLPNVIGTDGLAGPTKVLSIGGTRTTGEIEEIQVDSDGQLQIDVITSALPTGAATSANQTNKAQYTRITDGTDDALVTAAGELNVLATAQPGVDIGDITINNASGASAVNIQDGGNSITVDGTVTANIGTTGGLALDATLTGGTMRTKITDGTNNVTTLFDADSGAGTQYLQGVSLRKTASGGSVELGTATDPIRTDPTGTTTQPISAASLPLPTGAATEATLNSIKTATELIDNAVSGAGFNITQFGGAAVPIGAGLEATAVRVTLPTDGTGKVNAAQSGTWNITNVSGTVSLPTGASTLAEQQTQTTALQLIDDIVHSTNAALGKAAAIAGQLDDTGTTAATENNVAPVRITAQRALHSNLRNDAGTEIGTATTPVRTDPTGTTTQPVSGTITANAGTNLNTSALALEATLTKLPIAQGTALGSNSGPMMQGSVTTGAPTYTTGQISPLSLTTGGLLRVDNSGVTQPISSAALSNIESSTNTMDDWDETDRCKVNPIAGQAGVQGGSGAVTALTQRVVLATDVALPAGTNAIGKLSANSGVDIGDVDVLSIAAGSNLIGDVGISGARTSGGTTIFRTLDLDETEEEVKATAGQVYWIHAINLSTGVRYLKIYNATAATVVVGTTTPVMTLPIPTLATTNGNGFFMAVPNGIAFGTAITIAATTGIADADTGAPGANDVVVNLGYA